MKKFEKTLTITIPVQRIAEALLSQMNEKFAYRESVVEAIITLAQESGGLNFIYNALTGFSNKLNFEVGQIIDCSAQKRKNADYPEKIGVCKIVEINEYTNDNIRVSYRDPESNELHYKWVSMESCSQIVFGKDSILKEE